MNPLVSVYCLAYNHEKYIRDALEGFVSQKTNFPFEVFVHDDASTDNTAQIIKEYETRYPEIIRPIYQSENQYSKHIAIAKQFIFPRMKGKYIAVCEGDDYWCDEEKLQRQVDWLENNPDYSMCVHNTRVIEYTENKERLMNNCTYDKDIPFEDIIQGGGSCFHTSSFMYRAEYMEIPDGFKIRGVGDYPRAVYLSLCGKVRYLHEVMSVYRSNIEGSYTRRMNVAPLSVRKERNAQIIQMLHYADEYSHGMYKDYIDNTIKQKTITFLLEEGNIRNIKEHYYSFYKEMSIKEKIKLRFKSMFPKLIQYYHKMINK